MYIQLAQIEATTSRVPFSANELSAAVEAIRTRRSKGTDLALGDPTICPAHEDVIAAAKDGVMVLHSFQQLKRRFLFVKCDGGRSFLGRQKAVYASYIGDLTNDEWVVGPMFKMWAVAVTSVGNLYQAEGYR